MFAPLQLLRPADRPRGGARTVASNAEQVRHRLLVVWTKTTTTSDWTTRDGEGRINPLDKDTQHGARRLYCPTANTRQPTRLLLSSIDRSAGLGLDSSFLFREESNIRAVSYDIAVDHHRSKYITRLSDHKTWCSGRGGRFVRSFVRSCGAGQHDSVSRWNDD
jgi:hypothetical protein